MSHRTNFCVAGRELICSRVSSTIYLKAIHFLTILIEDARQLSAFARRHAPESYSRLRIRS